MLRLNLSTPKVWLYFHLFPPPSMPLSHHLPGQWEVSPFWRESKNTVFLQRARCTAVSSVSVRNSSDSLCVDSKEYNKKKILSEREQVGCRCKSKDYKDTGRGNENTIWMADLTKTGWMHVAPYVPSWEDTGEGKRGRGSWPVDGGNKDRKWERRYDTGS